QDAITPFGTIQRDGRAEGGPPTGAHAFAPRHRFGRAQSAVPTSAARPYRVSRWWKRARSAGRSTAERLRHRHVRPPVSGQKALPELLDHRPPVSPCARPVRTEGGGGRHVPATGAAGRGDRAGRSTGRAPDGSSRPPPSTRATTPCGSASPAGLSSPARPSSPSRPAAPAGPAPPALCRAPPPRQYVWNRRGGRVSTRLHHQRALL